VATVVPWARTSGTTPRPSSSASPVRTASPGSCGVDGTLVTVPSSATRSVKVPPVSLPTRRLTCSLTGLLADPSWWRSGVGFRHQTSTRTGVGRARRQALGSSWLHHGDGVGTEVVDERAMGAAHGLVRPVPHHDGGVDVAGEPVVATGHGGDLALPGAGHL